MHETTQIDGITWSRQSVTTCNQKWKKKCMRRTVVGVCACSMCKCKWALWWSSCEQKRYNLKCNAYARQSNAFISCFECGKCSRWRVENLSHCCQYDGHRAVNIRCALYTDTQSVKRIACATFERTLRRTDGPSTNTWHNILLSLSISLTFMRRCRRHRRRRRHDR